MPLLPQWSPPVGDGSTNMTWFEYRAFTSAAMEPAGHRREYPVLASCELTPSGGPQWSPPVTGGNTAPRIRAV
jgi:hypothetical protein